MFDETRELNGGHCGTCWKIANKGPLIGTLVFATSAEQQESDMLPALVRYVIFWEIQRA